MTDCARCGDCCEQIWLSAQVMDRLARSVAGEVMPEAQRADLDFIEAHWHVLETLDDGGAKLSCDQFDAEARVCTAHDERPPVCRGYPWYGAPPTQAVVEKLSPHCSFVADLIPVPLGATR